MCSPWFISVIDEWIASYLLLSRVLQKCINLKMPNETDKKYN